MNEQKQFKNPEIIRQYWAEIQRNYRARKKLEQIEAEAAKVRGPTAPAPDSKLATLQRNPKQTRRVANNE